ncbi:hypothetical protein GGI10_006007, partial [Coemansia sp. RSA 2530]
YYFKSNIESEEEFLAELKDLVEAEDFPLQGIELHEDSFAYELTRKTDSVKYSFYGLRANSAS